MRIFTVLILLVFSGCEIEKPLSVLPEKVDIDLVERNSKILSVKLSATPPPNGATGFWQLLQTSKDPLNFEVSTSATCWISGTLSSEYTIRWTLTNGYESIYKDYDLNFAELYTLDELIATNVPFSEILKHYTIDDLLQVNISIEFLYFNGVTLAQLLENDVTLAQLLEFLDLQTIHQHFTFKEMLSIGVSIEQLLDSYSIAEILEEVTPEELVGYISVDELLVSHTLEELVNYGFSIQLLLDSSVTPGDLIPYFFLSELINNGVGLSELSDAGILYGEFIKAGVLEESLEAANLIGYVYDVDGNRYKWVKIGDQYWMAENLKAMHYPDHSTIADVYFYENSESHFEIYGALYTWKAASKNFEGDPYNTVVQGACPNGWHLPRYSEWHILTSKYGDKLKGSGSGLWLYSPYGNADKNNLSGFSALPAGFMALNPQPTYDALKERTFFMSTFHNQEGSVYMPYLRYDYPASSNHYGSKTSAVSVRCIKD